jgi:hypothetical protein
MNDEAVTVKFRVESWKLDYTLVKYETFLWLFLFSVETYANHQEYFLFGNNVWLITGHTTVE